MVDKQESNNNTTLMVLGGVLLGAVAGAAVGMLTAPKSGKETRSTIKSKASDLKNRLKKGVNKQAKEAKARLDEAIEMAKKLDEKSK